MREMRNAFEILVGKPRGKDHLKYVRVDWRIILECILEKCYVDWIRLRWPVASSCECGNEFSGFIEGGEEFLD
jgi:hypothetical protein